MKNYYLTIALISLLAACKSQAPTASTSAQVAVTPPAVAERPLPPNISPRTLIIFHEDTDDARRRLRQAIDQCGATIIYTYNTMSGMAISKSDDWTLQQTRAFLEKVEGVLSVSYDHITPLPTNPNRPVAK